jgi:hypothetical protein
MTEQAPLDLQQLDPGTPPDLVRGAMRRFRWRVVLVTVFAVVIAASAGAWTARGISHAHREAAFQSSLLSTPQMTILTTGGENCLTPTYRVGGSAVTVLQAARMPAGGWALHLIVRSGAPLTQERQFADGSGSASRFSSLSIVGTSSIGNVVAQPGAKIGEAYLGVPASSGDRLRVQLDNTRSQTVGSFDLHVAALARCQTIIRAPG